MKPLPIIVAPRRAEHETRVNWMITVVAARRRDKRRRDVNCNGYFHQRPERG